MARKKRKGNRVVEGNENPMAPPTSKPVSEPSVTSEEHLPTKPETQASSGTPPDEVKKDPTFTIDPP